MQRLGLPAARVPRGDETGSQVQVTVRTGEVVLSPGFEERDRQIQEAAREAGGRYVGWGGTPPPTRHL
jgi:hypothetical protein